MTQKEQRRRERLALQHADFLWSFNVRARAGFSCELAGRDHLACKGGVQAAHIVSRMVRATRLDVTNGRSLCAAHHVYYTHRPEAWAEVCLLLWEQDWRRAIEAKRDPARVVESVWDTGLRLLDETASRRFEYFVEYQKRIERAENYLRGMRP